MSNRLPADARRAQLVEAALTLAERGGPGAVTMRPVAEAAGVSLGLVHHRFDNKDELLAAMGESLVLQVGAGLREASGQERSAPAPRGVAGLRRMLQIGLRGIWPVIESTPGRQLLDYELTTVALRNRAAGDERAGHIAGRQYRMMDTEAVEFLQLCAQTTGVRWKPPVTALARLALAALDGLILRWLVDRDGDATLAALDDLAQMITAQAIELPDALDPETLDIVTG